MQYSSYRLHKYDTLESATGSFANYIVIFIVVHATLGHTYNWSRITTYSWLD
jgi:hypothetical protein